MKIAYFVHDLSDAAVHRRIRMLQTGSAEILVLGFNRSDRMIREVAGAPAIDLGRTRDARLGQRVWAVTKAALGLSRLRTALAGATVIMARQLEMLALASLVQRLLAPRAPLVYECLDVHRLMTSAGRAGAVLRGLERRLLDRSQLLVTSSPGFLDRYFEKTYATLPPVWLLENKVLESELASPAFAEAAQSRAALPAGPPWRIGWFGVIRCRRSLSILSDLLRQHPGLVEVVIRGKPARNVLTDFDRIVASTPGLHFHGPYQRDTELARIYADVHFTWAIDFYEAGANSDWLLPNRLYEGGICGAVPLALGSVETGRWLARRNTGLLLEEPLAESLRRTFFGLDAACYAALREAAAAVPLRDYVHETEDCRAFVARLASLAGSGPVERSAAVPPDAALRPQG